MKKIVIAAIAGVLTLGLAACEQRVEPASGASDTTTSTTPAMPDTSTTTITPAPTDSGTTTTTPDSTTTTTTPGTTTETKTQ